MTARVLRVEVLANDKASFIKPMADGLVRMLEDCGASARVHYDGIEQLMRLQSVSYSSARSFAGSVTRLKSNRRQMDSFVERMRGADLIVVVSHVPASFSVSALPNIEMLRALLPDVPVVNYDLVYLPTLDSWSRVILRNEKTKLAAEDLQILERGIFGMERYDWYLLASVGTYIPLEPGAHPYSRIGIDLDDGRLFPDQRGKFEVLVDFEQQRAEYPQFREIQLEALRIAGVKYRVLEGSYTRDEMLAVFRRSAVLMLAHAESFGLPICEAQACGALIFTPDLNWATAHWLGTDYYSRREPNCSSNFVLYENDPVMLAERLKSAAENFNPEQVRKTFIETQPEMLLGDRAELADFLSKVKSGEIHARLHPYHDKIGRSKRKVVQDSGDGEDRSPSP